MTVRAEEAHLLQGGGLSLLACDVHEDVIVTLHGDDGVELNRYLVDVRSSTQNETPTFSDDYASPPRMRRFRRH